MDDAPANQLSVQRNVILGLLLALAAGAWAVLVWQSAGADMDMTTASSTMGMRAPLFLAVWVIMMVAMMFPTATPMILTFHKVQAGKHQRGDAFVSTWVFVGAYILVWTLAGAGAYAGALASEAIAARAALSPATAARIGGVVLVMAGIYQLTSLKDLCLSKCRTPITFITTSWRDGAAGALRMGLLHGAYCLGCCWLLFPHSLSARHHEYRSDGSCPFPYLSRENAAVAAARTFRRGFRACVVWCAGGCVTPTPSHFPERWRRGYASRNADEDGRERERNQIALRKRDS